MKIAGGESSFAALMYDALRKQRQDVALVTLKHEDHWLSQSDTRTQMLEATVAFLRAHDPPDWGAAPLTIGLEAAR
ncbi:MAG: hypothetical protein ACYDAE_05180 [Steroidobacteraceae bacterium]